MNLQQVILVIAILSTILPVVAVFLRGRLRRMLMISTLLTAASVSALLGVVLRLLTLSPQYSSNEWVHALVALPVFLLLSGYLLSISFGRERVVESLRDARRTLGFLVVLGGVSLALQRHEAFLTGYSWFDGRGALHFGYLGRAYLSYLLIGIIIVGHNLEKTYRVSSGEVRARIRPAMLGIFGVLLFFTFILATGMLYSSIGMGRLISAGIPIACAGVLLAHGYLRGSISDATAPVSRSFVYTSFTALAAGLFVLSIAVAAQFATLTKWSPDEILIFAFGFLALLITILLSISNRFQRRVRRFIDRNFYVNRYDYRTQWSRLTNVLEDASGQDAVLDRVLGYVEEVFTATDVTIALRDPATGRIRPASGRGARESSVFLAPGTPLLDQLVRERRALILDRNPHDFTYIGVYAENQDWLDATAGRMIAPLISGTEFIGTIGVQRGVEDDRFTFEDASLLDSICTHVAAVLRVLRLASELADTREMELISQWSSMTLHDLKNCLTPLRLAVSNLAESDGDAEVVAACMASIMGVADRMEKLTGTLGEFRSASRLDLGVYCANDLVIEALAGLQVDNRPGLDVEMSLEAERKIVADRAMLRRVIENLVTNAIEAMNGSGTLRLATFDDGDEASARVHISVSDNGHGIPEEFLREQLFRPLATTKSNGLGLGLWQCRMIVQAHGGEISAESRLGKGTVFNVVLDADAQSAFPYGGHKCRQTANGKVLNEFASGS